MTRVVKTAISSTLKLGRRNVEDNGMIFFILLIIHINNLLTMYEMCKKMYKIKRSYY